MDAPVVRSDADSLKCCAHRSERPKHVAVCRESDSRGPLESIAARCQNDDNHDLACVYLTLGGVFRPTHVPNKRMDEVTHAKGCHVFIANEAHGLSSKVVSRW
jgi:hypothetical protein